MTHKTSEDKISISFECLKVAQPLGEFYIASISWKKLIEITYFDVRRIIDADRDIERYLGIQRPLSADRVKKIGAYVNTLDACFPTAVIIAVQDRCVSIDEEKKIMTLSNIPESDDAESLVYYRRIARVLDGQHRLAGLESFDASSEFDLNVSIFVDADMSDQASIFSAVNLTQTKVNRSLAYDLFDLANTRSPEKVAHNIVVTLDREEKSPFHKRVKRLGVATVGRKVESFTQATIIAGFIQYLSKNPLADRDIYLRGKTPEKLPESQLGKHPLQHMFVDGRDFDITDILWNYFEAVARKWPQAWANEFEGSMLGRTAGYQALIKFFRNVYISIATPGDVPSVDQFAEFFARITLDQRTFNKDEYDYGSSGAAKLYRELCEFL